MWWTVHLEGGPRRVNHAAVAMGERVFSFGDQNIFWKFVNFQTTLKIFSEKPFDLSPSVSAFLCSGGYCTGDNYRDERPIDVFVLNTSNYRWTEVVRKYLYLQGDFFAGPASQKCLGLQQHLMKKYQNLLTDGHLDILRAGPVAKVECPQKNIASFFVPGAKTWWWGGASRVALSKVAFISQKTKCVED